MLERLKIFELRAPYKFVLFDHNPEQMAMERSAPSGGRSHPSASGSGTHGVASNGSQPTKMKITKARLVGPETKRFCDQILAWMTPKLDPIEAAAALMTGTQLGARNPILLVQWGPPVAGFTFTATLTQASINYIRVSSLGMPTHATVSLALQEDPTFPSMTNPTSGGRPGRNRHIVHAHETLMSIATKTFGRPGPWRAIAEVNSIDDPGSIRPGDVIYLPAADELAASAEAAR